MSRLFFWFITVLLIQHALANDPVNPLTRELGHYVCVGIIDKVREILSQPDVDVNWVDERTYDFTPSYDPHVRGVTALHLATECNQLNKVEIVQLLLDHGADVNAREGSMGYTPLMLAAYHGHNETIELLLDHGADINATSKEGWTALMYAAAFSKQEWYVSNAVLVLHERGAPLLVRNPQGRTAAMLAAMYGQTGNMQTLLWKDLYKDSQWTDNYGETTLILASHYYCTDVEVVRHLLMTGLQKVINQRAKNGFTALMYAASTNKREIYNLLVLFGASKIGCIPMLWPLCGGYYP